MYMYVAFIILCTVCAEGLCDWLHVYVYIIKHRPFGIIPAQKKKKKKKKNRKSTCGTFLLHLHVDIVLTVGSLQVQHYSFFCSHTCASSGLQGLRV